MTQSNDYAEKRFYEEIEFRRVNNSWDQYMATRILSARRTRKFRLSVSFSLAGLSAAVCLVILFAVNGVSHKSIYEPFVTRQVEETFKAGGLSDSDVDQMIEETLAMR